MGRILLVEDSPADADLLCRTLAEQVGPGLDVVRAGSLGAATTRLRDDPPFDCAILDLSLPDGTGVGPPPEVGPATDALVTAGRAAGVEVQVTIHADGHALLDGVDETCPPHAVVHLLDRDGSAIHGLDTVVALRSALPRRSLLVVADPAQDDLALAALELGADDVVLRSAALRGELWHALRLSLQRRRLAEAHDTAARRDDLTGLPTRSQLMDELERVCTSMAQGGPESLAVMFLDLDGFKEVNDAFGHQVGDLVLRVDASRLQQAIRRADTVGRLGGDEFLLVVADVTAQDAAAMRNRVEDLITTPMAIDEGSAVLLGVSIGVVHTAT